MHFIEKKLQAICNRGVNAINTLQNKVSCYLC